MLEAVDLLYIIRRIVADKRAARREPTHALWREINQEYRAAGGTGNINDQLAALVEKGAVLCHRTATDKSFEPADDESETGE